MVNPSLPCVLAAFDGVGGKEAGLHELVEVMAELLADDLRFMREDREAAEPFRANVVVSFLEHEALTVCTVVEIGEMKEEAHVERLADGAEAHHQRVIETGEVFVLQRCDDRIGERDGARFDRIARELAPSGTLNIFVAGSLHLGQLAPETGPCRRSTNRWPAKKKPA